MEESDRIKELYRRYWTYMINKDEKGLKSLMADDYYLLHMTGVRQSKETFIKGLLLIREAIGIFRAL
ncbi:MAG: nuclear transport factor 2 family protein [Ruminococcus sp.]|nr:nuclear transport factor 2 family protein [Ruminococcus sp.]